MPTVACPKCKTKFKLATDQLGKAVRCTSCQAKFRTPAPASGGAAKSEKAKTKTDAKAKTKSKAKSSSKSKKKTPRSLEDELFASAPLKPGAPDPLGNFVLEDPGFGVGEMSDSEDDDKNEKDDMFADRKHLMNNPALKGRTPQTQTAGSDLNVKKTMKDRLLSRTSMIIGGVILLLIIVGLVYFFFFRGGS